MKTIKRYVLDNFTRIIDQKSGFTDRRGRRPHASRRRGRAARHAQPRREGSRHSPASRPGAASDPDLNVELPDGAKINDDEAL